MPRGPAEAAQLLLLRHRRGDVADARKRRAAVATFRELLAPCLRQSKNGIIDLGNLGRGTAHCLILLAYYAKTLKRVSAFIVICRDQAEASSFMQQARRLAYTNHPDDGAAGLAVPAPPDPDLPTLSARKHLDET